ncbi:MULTISPECIES: hypothetical protein [Cyanophyceae]|uniref:hypothetical protein n=1 Tax=Cyanophyceae TaxID=3028117 RepID=UPI001686E85D|nr:hypothetical protein [Trichocoleus sp. FACHB-69]MBD1930455.1 hypothetical protein [Trichocoleus sp. FACHB-69]
MKTNAQRLTQRALIIQCLTNRLWEASPEAITQILSELPDGVVEAIASKLIEVLEMGGSTHKE